MKTALADILCDLVIAIDCQKNNRPLECGRRLGAAQEGLAELEARLEASPLSYRLGSTLLVGVLGELYDLICPSFGPDKLPDPKHLEVVEIILHRMVTVAPE